MAAQPQSRLAIAEFLIRNRDLVLARLRRKLRAVHAARDVADTNDLFSSLAFRLDRAASCGDIRAATDAQLWAYILIASHSMVMENARVAARLRRLIGRHLVRTMKTATPVEAGPAQSSAVVLESLATRINHETDREIFHLKVRGVPNRAIAALLGLSADDVRQRWSRVCRTLRSGGE